MKRKSKEKAKTKISRAHTIKCRYQYHQAVYIINILFIEPDIFF